MAANSDSNREFGLMSRTVSVIAILTVMVAGQASFPADKSVVADSTPATSRANAQSSTPSRKLPRKVRRRLAVVPAGEDKIPIPGAVVKSEIVSTTTLLQDKDRKLTGEQQEQLERVNRDRRERFIGIERAGGWQKIFAAEVSKARQNFPKDIQQFAAAEQFLAKFAMCQRPEIADAWSEFNVFDSNFFTPFPDMDLIIEPFAIVVIEGCRFGNEPGEVRLLINSVPGGFITLPSSPDLSFWSDDEISTSMPLAPGIPDQPAHLVVIRKDGTATDPFPVQFWQRRVVVRLDPAVHLDKVAAVSTDGTSQDQLRVVQFAGTPPYSDVAADHYTVCCNVVTGTDRWLMKLQNGWHVPTAGEATILPQRSGWGLAVNPLYATSFDKLDGYTTCGLFSSWPGKIVAIAVNTPVDFTEYQQEVDVTWQAGSNCSGVDYHMGIYIVGPEGIPYD